ncbi:hypothetical protein MSG28_004044 [Choristoneura fumiferana]|uniref:Uncharacterized protein n=1 Tax=Choristoneura fumiferana TaxID=7141 RepID=A0ACC0KI73_CHOFU|nr:hypothetical protein MSG28_004044 [Choristoneura fumiferana]
MVMIVVLIMMIGDDDVIGLVLSFVSYTLTNSENHRTESDYEKSLVLKLFAFTFSFTCTLFLYIAFFKNKSIKRAILHKTFIIATRAGTARVDRDVEGKISLMLEFYTNQFYNHPSNPTRYKYWGILMAQCTIFGCSDELALSIFVTIITKDCVFKVISLLYGLLFMRTDYNQGRSANITVPCWEREYRLTPVKKDFVDDKLKSLDLDKSTSTASNGLGKLQFQNDTVWCVSWIYMWLPFDTIFYHMWKRIRYQDNCQASIERMQAPSGAK